MIRSRVTRLTAKLGATVGAAALGAGLLALTVAAPAQGAGRVAIDNAGNGAVIDATYSSTITVSGSGFQSVQGGHGGVYVWFGTVNGAWQPSKGGRSGVNYVYVPDSETKGNKGFQRYVAFPGSDTASSANGGTLSKDGSFRTQLVVPGPKFKAVGRDGGVTDVDCTKVTCGVITIGAHGVKNANNETFTPVRIADLQGGGSGGSGERPTQTPSQTSTPTAQPSATATPVDPSSTSVPTEQNSGSQGRPARKVKAALSVDHASAVPGRVLSVAAQGLEPGSQVTLVLDDGLVASGPHMVGPDGSLAGVISLPADLRSGTHELRTFGTGKALTVRFGVAAPTVPASQPAQADDSAAVGELTWPEVFALGAGGLFVLALVGRLLVGMRRRA